jgi:hypothetical protein
MSEKLTGIPAGGKNFFLYSETSNPVMELHLASPNSTDIEALSTG